MRSEELEQDRKIADGRLAGAVAESKSISDETERLRAIHRKINSTLAARDVEWEKAQWWIHSIDTLQKWAAGDGKLPKLGMLEVSETELRVLKVALDQIGTKLLVLSAREHMSLSEQLEYRSRLRHIDSIQAHFDAQEALESVGQAIGEGAIVNIEGGAAELLQRQADELLKESNSERERAEELVTGLPKTKGGR
jgi:hypothetical protein